MLSGELEDIRETLNRFVELEKENETFHREAVEDAKTISGLRCRMGDLMAEIRDLTSA